MGSDVLVGKIIDQYQILERLGEGGMARVYHAYRPDLDRHVALKVMSPEMTLQPGYLLRFEREARASAKLDHPNIVPIYDSRKFGNITYIVMKHLTGGSLDSRLHQRNTPLPSLGEIAQMLLALASALDYAHRLDIIHRDIKPANIMFDGEGKPYLVDFGIVKMMESQNMALTNVGMTMGSPAYMPPEQWAGEAIAASDQYALAATIYHTLTGRPPFEAKNTPMLMNKHLHDTPKPITEIRPDFPIPVMMVLGRAMLKEPAKRWESCTAFAQAFAQAVPETHKYATEFFTAPLKRSSADSYVEDTWTIVLPSAESPAASLPLTTRPSVAPVEPAPAPPPQSSSKRVWIVGLIGVLLLAGVGLIALFSAPPAPANTGGDSPTSAAIIILEDETETPTLELTETVAPTETGLPTDTPEPTATQTPEPSETPVPVPAVGMRVTALRELILRKDTSQFIIRAGDIAEGETAEIIELAEVNGVKWMRVRTVDNEEGWEKQTEFALIP